MNPSTATDVVLDGRRVAKMLLQRGHERSAVLAEEFDVVPHLSVVLVGEDPASVIYVRAKQRASLHAGVRSTVAKLPGDSTTDQVCLVIDAMAADPTIHGIIVQLPLPDGVDASQVLARVPVEKDADGFHLYNVGSLFVGESVYPPCTPEGVIRLLDSAGIVLPGAHAVVVGASNPWASRWR